MFLRRLITIEKAVTNHLVEFWSERWRRLFASLLLLHFADLGTACLGFLLDAELFVIGELNKDVVNFLLHKSPASLVVAEARALIPIALAVGLILAVRKVRNPSRKYTVVNILGFALPSVLVIVFSFGISSNISFIFSH